ncbi:AMP-binding protein [bacterium]|nr:AMP-binding protein [bacterium]
MQHLKLERNIGALVESAAERYGDKTVLIVDHQGITLSFVQLNRKVNQFANALAEAGIKTGDHVGVMLPNCVEFPCVWLALAKLGAVMVPLNVRYQAFDLEYVLNDSDAVALIAHTSLAPIYKKIPSEKHNVRKVLLIGENAGRGEQPLSQLAETMADTFQPAEPELDSLMNIQYTSGTTGFAKGVMTTHEYWLACGATAATLGFSGDDMLLAMSPFYYMDPQWELIMALSSGGAMVMAEKISAENFLGCLKKYPVTITWGSEDLLYLPPFTVEDGVNLKLILLSAFPPELHQQFEKHFEVIAREVYGMTEIGAGSAVPLEDAHMVGSGSIGKPVFNREFRIVNESGKDVACGEVGELLVSGPGILKGYYNKPEANEKAFLDGHFRTGDLARCDDAGYYYFVGRIKDMIRRMGDNISAEEVEKVLMSHPKIMEAAVIGVPDKTRDEEVKAYIVPAPGENPESIPPEEIVAFCLERIAKFKVPRYIEYRTEFPRSTSNKIQKHKLTKEKEDLTSDCFDRFA